MKLATIAGRSEPGSDVIGVEIVRCYCIVEFRCKPFLRLLIDPNDRQNQLEDKNVDSLGVIDVDAVVCSRFTAVGTR